MSRFSFLILTVVFLYLTSPDTVRCGLFPEELVHDGGYIVSRNGTILLQHRQDERFVPASTIKLLTALVSIDTLGLDYRYSTSFYIDAGNTLYVKGSGDPFLTSEYLSQIVRELKARGVHRISGYVLDDSAFQLEHDLPSGSENSTNPYDAPNGALAVNFNSISIIRQKNGQVGSGENQTPTIPIAREIGKQLPPGNHRININHFPLTGKINPQLRYVTEILHTLAKKEGIATQLQVRPGEVPDDLSPVYIYTSPRTLHENIQGCLHFSNNFIANQLALTAAARTYGYPATWHKAKLLLNNYAHETLHIDSDAIQIEEGSGLSRTNSASPKAMLTILDNFYPWRDLLPKRRGALLKSGTMKSVYCYAGYVESQTGAASFAILLNQKHNTRNHLMKLLKEHVAAHP